MAVMASTFYDHEPPVDVQAPQQFRFNRDAAVLLVSSVPIAFTNLNPNSCNFSLVLYCFHPLWCCAELSLLENITFYI
jgi:hypothetical protein